HDDWRYAACHLTDVAHLPYPVSVADRRPCRLPVGCRIGRCFRSRATIVNGLLVSIGLISVIESGALLIVTPPYSSSSISAQRLPRRQGKGDAWSAAARPWSMSCPCPWMAIRHALSCPSRIWRRRARSRVPPGSVPTSIPATVG